MLIIYGTNPDLHPCMRLAVQYADEAFKRYAKREGIMTSGRDREHSSGSFHYYGLAFDLRINDLSRNVIDTIVADLKKRLPAFDVILERTHIHIEVGQALGKKLGAYIA